MAAGNTGPPGYFDGLRKVGSMPDTLIEEGPAENAPEMVRVVHAERDGTDGLCQLARQVDVPLECIAVEPPYRVSLTMGDLFAVDV